MRSKVIVLGPGRNTRGGITMVIKEYERTEVWKDFDCKWISTYIDRGGFQKIYCFLRGYITYIKNVFTYDIIHIHMSWSTTAIRKLFFFIPAQILNKRIILHIHSGAEPIVNSNIRTIYRFMFKYADVTILLANKIAIELNKHFYIKDPVVLYNPCLSYKPTESSFASPKKKYILFAGTITKKKGYIDLIQAFSSISKEYSEWKLVFAGNGEIEDARALTKLNDIEERVILKGWLNRDKLQQLFEASSIFCLPSYTEGFPMAVLDAWAHGLPVITTPVGGLPDVLIPEVNALVFEPGDIDMLAQHLRRLITDEILRDKISAESIRLSQGPFSLATVSKQLNELYLRLS